MFLSTLLLAFICGIVIYNTSLVVYRLFISPLSSYPGPFLTKISYAYEFYYDAWQPGNYIWQIEKLHKRYGPIVRVNPNEIHINDPSFYDEIYPPPPRKRNVYDWSRRGLDAPHSLGATVDHNIHRIRRDAFNPFWSRANIVTLEPMINQKIDFLCNRLANEPGAVNLSNAFLALTVDVINQFAFGKDSGFLRREDMGGQWRRDLTDIMRNAKVLTHFNFLTTLMNKLPNSFVLKHGPPAVADLLRYKKDIRRQVDEVLSEDPQSKKTDQAYRTIFHHLRDDPNLPAFEKAPGRLQQEGQVLVLAGSETTAKTLSIIMFHLLDKPTWFEKVRSEVKTVLPADGSPPRWNDLETLPILKAVVHEGLRLNFGITGRNQRYTIDETLTLGTQKIPPGVPMSMMSLFMNANADIFPEPFTFAPDRWLAQESSTHSTNSGENNVKFLPEKTKYLASFGRGARRCIAINLANAELYLSIAAVVTRLKFRLFETDESDVRFMHDFTVLQSRLDSKGVRVLIEAR